MDRIPSRFIRIGLAAALLASLAFLVVVPNIRNVPRTTSVTTPSGRRIPHDILRSRLTFIPEREYETHIFELTEEGRRLRGHRFSDHFHVDADNNLHKDLDPLPSYRLNGRRITSSAGRSRLLSVNNGKYSASVDASGRVLAIWGKGLSLTPIHIDDYPNVFLHTPDMPHDVTDDAVQTSSLSRKTVSYTMPKMRQLDNTTCTPDSQPRVYTIVVAFDNSFCATYGNNADLSIAAIKAGIALADEIYSYQTCIKLLVTDTDAHCQDPADPYRASLLTGSSAQFLADFETYWENTLHPVSVGDQAYLFSSLGDARGTFGRARLDSACQDDGIQWTHNLPFTTIAHEIAHTLSARHNQGSRHLMDWGRYRFGYLTFSAPALAQVRNYVTADTGNCLVSPENTAAARPGIAVTATCGTLLPPNRLFGCGHEYTRVANELDVVMDQYSTLFYVALFPLGDRRIMSAKTFVGLDEVTDEFNLRPNTVAAGGVERVDYTYHLDQWPSTQSAGSCCGSDAHVSTKVRLCSGPDYTTGCVEHMVNTQLTILCEDPCGGGPGNKKYVHYCPVCEV